MAQLVAVSSMSDLQNGSITGSNNNHNNHINNTDDSDNRRKIAASEDIYFGNHHQNGLPQQQYQQQQQQQSSLLGQALQAPSLVDRDSIPPAEEYYEHITPTCTTRKSSNSHNNNSNQHHQHHNSIDGGHHTPQQQNKGIVGGMNFQQALNNSNSSLRTRTGTNSSSSNNHNNNSTLADSAAAAIRNDSSSICLSNRSLASDDSVAAASLSMMIPQSVDTVPTSNVATFHQYQQQQQKFNALTRRAQQQQQPQMNANNKLSVSPPNQLRFHHPSAAGAASAGPTMTPSSNAPHDNLNNNDANNTKNNNDNGRRAIFGGRVQQRYPNPSYTGGPPQDPAPFYNMIENDQRVILKRASLQPPDWETLPPVSSNEVAAGTTLQDNNTAPAKLSTQQQQETMSMQPPPPVPSQVITPADHSLSTLSSPDFASIGDSVNTYNNNNERDQHHPNGINNNHNMITSSVTSNLTPPQSPLQDALQTTTLDSLPNTSTELVSPLHSPPLNLPPSLRGNNNNNNGSTISNLSSSSARKGKQRHKHSSRHYNSKFTTRKTAIHETVHAQSLLLGLCFMAIWSPNNIMAPNLTQIATFYGMTESERDLYLGSFLALATGVLSFPLSALIGIMTDLYSRKHLFVATAMGGAVAALATGISPTYPCLLLARFFSGGFMSASVSVAFSLMGDLFATEERNAASSGLTAMMGLGIVLGQVYAGSIGTSLGWQHAFFVSSGLTVFLGLCVACLVQEPVRGGKEKVLQDMLQQGKRYDRKLTWDAFWQAMTTNRSNFILMAQGFFSSMPWGIIFVFLNDYLSQERGFTVPDATFIVLIFGIGCAIGGILGGYMGAWIQSINRTFLPLFMSITTILGILPFLALLNGHTTNAHGMWAMLYSVLAGVIASLPAVNVRPCLINVNPPETRGASLTAANLIVNLARGVGPCCITLLGSTFRVSRQVSFNVTLAAFWIVSGLQLCFLASSLPHDQDKMEAELARYAASAMAVTSPPGAAGVVGPDNVAFEHYHYPERPADHRPESSKSLDGDETLLSIEDRMTTFDGTAAFESISFFQKGMSEINFGRGKFCAIPAPRSNPSEDDDDYYYDESESGEGVMATPRSSVNVQHFLGVVGHPTNRRHNEGGSEDDDQLSPEDMLRRRDQWIRAQQQRQQIYGAISLSSENDDEQGQDQGGSSNETNPSETTRLL